MRRSIYLIIFCFCCNLIYGQFSNLKFESYSTEEGLSSSTCLELFQDSEGFLWFGTIDGLNKYNGYEFEVFRPILNNSTSISNNRINTIKEDLNGVLWIGTDNGLNVYDKSSKVFTQINLYEEPLESFTPREVINTIFYDKKSDLIWVGTNKGVVKITLTSGDFDIDKLAFKHYVNDENNTYSLDNNIVNEISEDKDGVIWVLTNGNSLNKYNKKDDSFHRVLIDVKGGYKLNHLPKNLLIDDHNNFWIGNDISKIVVWDKSKNIFKKKSFDNKSISFYDFYEDSTGKIWMPTDGEGVYLYDKKTNESNKIIHNDSDPYSIPNNQISKVLEDDKGVFWLATYNEGVCKLDLRKSKFGHYFFQKNKKNWLKSSIVQSVLEDSKNRIWISSYNGGLSLFDEKQMSFKTYSHNPRNKNTLSSNKILNTFEGKDHSIWVCTLDGGLNKFNPRTKSVKRFLHNEKDSLSIGVNAIWSAIEDDYNRVWIGTRGEGLDLLDTKTEKFSHFRKTKNSREGLLSNDVTSLKIDSQNRLLIGTSLGLNYLFLDNVNEETTEKNIFQQLYINGVSGNRINCIEEDKSQNIWIGTDNGLFKLDNNLRLLKSYFCQNGLVNNFVTGVVEDLNNHIWITTKGGLSFLNPQNHQIKNFNIHDGIQGTEYQTKSIELTEDGRVIAGGINGFNIFNPKDISVNSKVKLEPKIIEFKINNIEVRKGDEINNSFVLSKSITETKKINLKYDQSNLSFSFIALHFQNQEQVKYAYKMEGVDKHYVSTGSNRMVNYSNLQPGSYKFMVKSSLDGNWSDAPMASIFIEVQNPPWRSITAYVVYLVIILLLLWYVQKFYKKRLNHQNEREFDQLKLKFFINVSHEFRTPLTLILNPLDKLMEEYNNPEVVKTTAVSIQRSARRLLYLVNQLLDYRKMEVGMSPLQLHKGDVVKFSSDIFDLFKEIAAKKNIDYTFNSNTSSCDSFFDFDKIEKILTNLISNAMKFTNAEGEINVSVNKVVHKNGKTTTIGKKPLGKYIQIDVQDTGIGLDKEQVKKIFSRFYNVDAYKTGTGIGLNFTKGLVEIHGGDIFVESKYNEGTKFTVRLPVTTNAKSSDVKPVKDEFLINSMKSAEYDMLISDENDTVPDEVDENKGKLPKVLIVEDNKELRRHLKTELSKKYQVLDAQNGEEGLKIVTKKFPDIVISDIMMPKMDGFELCKQIKSEFETCHIPVILLTARTLEEDRVSGYQTGADAYLNKPFNMAVLQARISNLLETKRVIREKFSKLGAVITPTEATSNSIDEAFIEKTTKIILDNISDTDFKLENLLKEVGVGRSQFYRKIQSITGQNPSNFIRTIRLKYASELLLKDIYTIKEVTHMCGFNSAAYFGKTFRTLYNMTPSEYVETNKKKKED